MKQKKEFDEEWYISNGKIFPTIARETRIS